MDAGRNCGNRPTGAFFLSYVTFDLSVLARLHSPQFYYGRHNTYTPTDSIFLKHDEMDFALQTAVPPAGSQVQGGRVLHPDDHGGQFRQV